MTRFFDHLKRPKYKQPLAHIGGVTEVNYLLKGIYVYNLFEGGFERPMQDIGFVKVFDSAILKHLSMKALTGFYG